jgi:hypothetical protein
MVFRPALRRVALGQIVADEHGRLRHHSDVLAPHVLSTLATLHQHEFITLVHDSTRPERRVAELTPTGTQLLDWLNRQVTGAPGSAAVAASEVAGTTSLEVGDDRSSPVGP